MIKLGSNWVVFVLLALMGSSCNGENAHSQLGQSNKTVVEEQPEKQIVDSIATDTHAQVSDVDSNRSDTNERQISSTNVSETIPVQLQCLKEAYPEHLCDIKPNALIWCDGTKMKYDDEIENKDHETLLNNPDLQDQMEMQYTLGDGHQKPIPENFEPGRVRYEPFFKKMYGASKAEVRKKMRKIEWMPGIVEKTIWISTVNNIDKKLEAVSNELEQLPASFKNFVDTPAGTFNWRVIKGTNRLSMHSFAVSVDINIKQSDYWKWSKPDSTGKFKYKNKIPMEIVKIFEKHGFIWGGKWYHYDTMHFEYRPELLHPKCLTI